MVLGLSLAGCSGDDGNSADTSKSGSEALSATLNWTAPTMNTDGSPLTDLGGYVVLYGTASRIYSGSLKIGDPGITSASVEGLPSGLWYFSVKSGTEASTQWPVLSKR